jgi:hypothetical protein
MKILDPLDELPTWLALADFEGERSLPDTPPNDDAQRAAERLGRLNVSYEHVWGAVRKAEGRWVPVRCDSLKRALLLASAAIQHRTQQHEVWRRGKVVCIRATGIHRTLTLQREAIHA